MKTRGWLVLSITIFALLYAAVAQREEPGRQIMKEKLLLAQEALAGIATEDWPLVAKSANRLRGATQGADWRVFDNPGYASQTALFRIQVAALAAAAEKKDIDSATLAYFKVTLSCVECHKMIRGKILADLKDIPALTPNWLTAQASEREGNP